MTALVEAYNEWELDRVLEAGATVVGVNNRDLRTFQVDLNNSIRLRRMVPREIPFVSESGIQTAGDMEKTLREWNGWGTNRGDLMRAEDKRAMLAQLREIRDDQDQDLWTDQGGGRCLCQCIYTGVLWLCGECAQKP